MRTLQERLEEATRRNPQEIPSLEQALQVVLSALRSAPVQLRTEMASRWSALLLAPDSAELERMILRDLRPAASPETKADRLELPLALSEEAVVRHRRQRLEEAVQRWFGGVERALAQAVNRQPSKVSDMIAGRKALGAKVARRLERDLRDAGKNCPDFWFDEPGRG